MKRGPEAEGVQIKTPTHREKSLQQMGLPMPWALRAVGSMCSASRSHLRVWVRGLDHFEMCDGRSE